MVFTYHLFNTNIKWYLLQNFHILLTEQQTQDIFPQPPFVAYKCNLSLRDKRVHSTENSCTEQPGSCACHHPLCHNTYEFINPLTDIRGPKSTFTIHNHITCMLGNLVYCITHRRCSNIYIGETLRSLKSQFGEHFQSIRNDTPAGHSITDVQVWGMRLCRGTNILYKQLQMKLIFQLGTVQPDGLNINFEYL